MWLIVICRNTRKIFTKLKDYQIKCLKEKVVYKKFTWPQSTDILAVAAFCRADYTILINVDKKPVKK